MRFPTHSARVTPLNPVVLLIGRGVRVDYMRTKLRRLGSSVASAESISDAASLLRCSSFDAVVISADMPESGWAIAQDLRRVLGCDAPAWIVSDSPPALPLRHEARANRVQFYPRKQGLPLLLDSLIRRTFDNLVWPAIVASELQWNALVAQFFEC